MENVRSIVQEQAEDALKRIGIYTDVTAGRVAQSVLHQKAYWEQSLSGGDKLLFVRFFSPVIQRDEVFLGNILFNDFLSKTFVHAVRETELGDAELVANDLESYYFLIRADSGMEQLIDEFRVKVKHSLSNLLFGDQNEVKGIYGNIKRIISGTDSRYESFPVYAIPECLAGTMENAVRKAISELTASLGSMELKERQRQMKRLRTVFAFLYGRTSGGTGDAQSFPWFVYHLATDVNYDNLLTVEEVKRVFNIQTVSKPRIKESLDAESYSINGLRDMMRNLLEKMGATSDAGNKKWVAPFALKDGKFIRATVDQYLDAIISGVQIGYLSLYDQIWGPNESGMECRFCGQQIASVRSSMVITGVAAFARHNQSLRQPKKEAPRICLRCGLCSYLQQKLLGTQSKSIGGSPPKFPMIPKNYNLIFHYGDHDNAEVNALAKLLEDAYDGVAQWKSIDSIRRGLRKRLGELRKRSNEEKREDKKAELNSEIIAAERELDSVLDQLADAEDALARLFPHASPPHPNENPTLDGLYNIQPEDSKIERHVLGLGMGGYRMILFVLPYMRKPIDRKGTKPNDYTQSRFSPSRVTVTTVLSFLREMCKCNGPFYYQSLPRLTPDAFQPDTFYVRDEAIHIQEAQNKYEMIARIAWQLIWQTGGDGFVRKVILAEKLLADPLVTFSAVMRNSPILGQARKRDCKYKRLKGEYHREWKAQDLTAYASFYQQLSELKEEGSMALKIDHEDLDEFCPKLFRILDKLGLLPLHLWAKPNEFEKYPRLLFGSIRRYDSVKAGVDEWVSRVLRVAHYRKERYYPDLEALRNWMMQHEEVFTRRTNMQHLHTSLYARVFQYAYPRRVLAIAYCEKHKGELNALGEEVLAEQFPSSIVPAVQKIKETYHANWDTIVADTRSSLLANAAYYKKILKGEIQETPLEDLEGANLETDEED